MVPYFVSGSALETEVFFAMTGYLACSCSIETHHPFYPHKLPVKNLCLVLIIAHSLISGAVRELKAPLDGLNS